MVLDLIKEYLVGIGFKVDANSLDGAKTSIGEAESKIKEFNDNSNEGFSETGNSLKDLFSILNSSGNLSKLFPEMEAPLKDILVKVALLKKIFKDINNSKLEDKEVQVKEKIIEDETLETKGKDIISEKKVKVKEVVVPLNDEKDIKPKKEDLTIKKESTLLKETPKAAPKKENITKDETNVDELVNKSSMLSESLGNVKNTAKTLLTEGGGALKAFSASALGPIAIVTTAIVGTVLAVKKLVKSFNDLANKDIEAEKLSRQLWTTKETAKEIDSALKGVGATMEDLWLSPTLLKQFNQLRKDSASLRLPPEFKDNIKVVQGIGLEFKRLKQSVSLLFQWIGHYILKYLAGPLNEIRGGFKNFNDWLIQHIPQIAEVIGTIIGVLLRILLIIGKIIGFLWKLTSPIRGILNLFKKLSNAVRNAPEGVKTAVKAIVATLALIFAPIIVIIALVDDFFTFLRGGKSVIGDVFGFFGKIGGKALSKIKEKFGSLKEAFKDGMSAIKDGWNGYWERASENFDKIKEKAKNIWKDIKEWSKGIWDKGKEFASNIGKKVVEFVGGEDVGNSVAAAPKSYVTNNSNKSSVSTTTNDNKVSNKNVINVYGTDPNSTAKAVDKRLTGISTRNLQGVIE